MAFANGVVMRSGSSWAWARDDGTVLHGTSASLLEDRRWLRLPVLRSAVSFIEMTAFSLRLHRLNGGRRSVRLLAFLIVCILASVALSSAVHAVIDSQILGGVVLQASGMLLALAVLQLGMGTQVWRYHGAEHKVVNAYEARRRPQRRGRREGLQPHPRSLRHQPRADRLRPGPPVLADG